MLVILVMLTVYLGNFHPDLEDALCRNISAARREDPLSPLAVIVPSGRIRSRIKQLLTGERGINLLNIHFLTFHGLAARLYEERYGLIRHLQREDFFFAEFIRALLGTGISGCETFQHLRETPEGCATLWATLKDLKEAKVDPETVAEAIREGLFGAEDAGKITPLILLYKEFLLRKRALDIMDYADVVEIAAELVPVSKYLQRFKEIIYYGFYDLTQVQYDLFRFIVRHYTATLYFPLVEGMAAFSFARRFFEGYIQGIVHDQDRIIRVSDPVQRDPGCDALFPFGHISRVISTSGAEDEVLTAAKGILGLVDREGYSFSDIGVVSREIGDYIHLIKRIFAAHKIPFSSSAGEPLSRYQAAKAVHLFISIHEGDYRRSDVIDLLSSGYCRAGTFCPDGLEPRPDIWDMVTRSIGISKGINEWERLDRYIADGFALRDEEDDKDGSQVIGGDQLEGLKRFVTSLRADFAELPEISSWRDYADRFKTLIRKYIDVEDFVEEALISLKEFDLISHEISLSEFMAAFSRRIEGMYIPAGDRNIEGVEVLDAMAARCIPFKVLFVLGMNEKVFPRNIREDPFLRDSARGGVERGLGYKITEKLNGFEEEKLLFYLILTSARERIYILYQRTDDAGQIKVPSWYLSEIKMRHSFSEERVPRKLSDKFESSDYFSCHLLTPRELIIRSILNGKGPGPIILKFNLKSEMYQHGFKAVQLYERMVSTLSSFDGYTGRIDSHWHDIRERGISPSSLEMYARCPFSYFACHLLGLRRLNRPETVFEVSPAETGDICHKILKRFYSRISDVMNQDIDVERYLNEEASAVFKEFEETNPVGYPLIWVALQNRLLAALRSVIKYDLYEMVLSGFKPYNFEIEARGYFLEGAPEYMRDVPVRGFLDRIDIRPDTGKFRIIDYKFRSGRRINNEDRNLSLSAIRGKRLQPPLYLLMAMSYLKTTWGIKEPEPEKVSFYFVAPKWLVDGDGEEGVIRSDFPGECWQTPIGASVNATVALLLQGIKEGLFFIFPDGYCDHCDYATLCRKNHFPSRWRAERDEKVKPYYAIRKIKDD